MSVSEVAVFLLALGQQVWQQEEGRTEGATVCLVSLAPFLLAGAAIGVRSVRRVLRERGCRKQDLSWPGLVR